MKELRPGLWHWRALRETIGMVVSSYYLERDRVAIDVLIPPEGLEWLERHGPPEHVLLSNRHHDRDAWRLQEEFGATVHCPRSGLRELERRGPVEAYEAGAELPGGIVAHEVGSLCPDESALHIPAQRALACADGVVRWEPEEPLGFVPDSLMDDPEETKAGLCAAYRRLLALDFDTLLLAHGDPIVGTGKAALEDFVASAAAG
ncbi:MAG TPA: hypothetical protein VGG41_11115 [Solirubrobacteraceae bacterium]|jgi:hypothetical protein